MSETSMQNLSPGSELSFEFFPPKTPEGADKLRAAHTRLAGLEPRFFSVTFGAGGSTQERTYDTVVDLQGTGSQVAPHLSCIGSSRERVRDLLLKYRDQGVRRIVALRGDLPSGMGEPGELRYANELVAFIREETGDHFHIEVAAYPEFHPQAPNAEADLANFVRKVKAGADSAITQYFYNADAYFRFVDECLNRGVEVPIVPGVMPITNASQLMRFSDACGAEIPRWIRKRLDAFGDDTASIRAFGEEVVLDLSRRLLEAGAPGLHFYTLNRAEPTYTMCEKLFSSQ